MLVLPWVTVPLEGRGRLLGGGDKEPWVSTTVLLSVSCAAEPRIPGRWEVGLGGTGCSGEPTFLRPGSLALTVLGMSQLRVFQLPRLLLFTGSLTRSPAATCPFPPDPCSPLRLHNDFTHNVPCSSSDSGCTQGSSELPLCPTCCRERTWRQDEFTTIQIQFRSLLYLKTADDSPVPSG